jgi:hypothetical protein
MEVFLDTGPWPGRPSRRYPAPRAAVVRKADPPAFYRRALRAALTTPALAALAYLIFKLERGL